MCRVERPTINGQPSIISQYYNLMTSDVNNNGIATQFPGGEGDALEMLKGDSAIQFW